MGHRRDLDTAGIGQIAVNRAEELILQARHLFVKIDGSIDKGIDGYIRLRKKAKFNKVENNKTIRYTDYVETGNIVGVQVKGVSSIPATGSNSYYINLADKTKFGVNFSNKANLDKQKEIWKNFIGPVILIFVDLETRNCWWADLNDEKSYFGNEYYVTVEKKNEFTIEAFKEISKLGRELFATNRLIDIDTKNYEFYDLSLTNFKKSAKDFYSNLSDEESHLYPTKNPKLGEIKYSLSGWKHITRLNRRKMRIFNSLLLLGVSKLICEKVERYTSVKKGVVRESKRYIKKVEFVTLRANINFNFRQSTIVQVVLRRVKTFDKLNPTMIIPVETFFHSIYEPYRKE